MDDNVGPFQVGRTFRPDDMEHLQRLLPESPRQIEKLCGCEVGSGASLIDLDEWPRADLQGDVRRREFGADAPTQANKGSMAEPPDADTSADGFGSREGPALQFDRKLARGFHGHIRTDSTQCPQKLSTASIDCLVGVVLGPQNDTN
ncbi:hypothetical protein [Arthrobacter sp. R-11]|uniref:hypothetical protein n=1 Tax=Arthrobacter sp. R-11 TaxID=3404053 RepID=UPI003CE6C8A9